MRTFLVSALMSLLSLLPVQAQTFRTWARHLEARGVKVSAGVWNLDSGKLVEGYHTTLALTPASTTKVVSTYALLKALKPNAVLNTEVWGALAGDTVTGDLVLKGSGDPFLTSERLWSLAQELRKHGILRVQGRIRLDQSAFDGQRFGNGWENTSEETTPPILPLSVNFNRDEKGQILKDPEPLALEIIARIFREAGLQIMDGPAQEGEMARLLSFPSLPLRTLVQDINKYSNNFMIEMLVKRLGEGTWPAGIQKIQGFYQDVFGMDETQVAITDGSGLSKENRLSARTLATILRAAWNDFEVGPEFVASLKVFGGEPWELSVKDPNLDSRVRFKTGHLADVNCLCGYVQTPKGDMRVFAILLNGEVKNEDLWPMVSRWAN
ncbi:MAG TPA: D-alanyl-D-alanine carboxypeptidase [Holophaga sp.]|nr:D-alanyl-D-alanine carboxypeptidase [Holophaga sp.]